jgi:hypothetical protein
MAEFGRPPQLGEHPFTPDVAEEIAVLRAHRGAREAPERANDRLLLATWNVANFDVQDREPAHFELIAEMVSWFDIVALQEIRDDLSGLRELRKLLPAAWRMVFSEAGGNDERQAFLWDSGRVQLGEKIGKLAVPRLQLKQAFGTDISAFDRTPYIASFRAANLTLVLVSVHSYFVKGKNAIASAPSDSRDAFSAPTQIRGYRTRRSSRSGGAPRCHQSTGSSSPTGSSMIRATTWMCAPTPPDQQNFHSSRAARS